MRANSLTRRQFTRAACGCSLLVAGHAADFMSQKAKANSESDALDELYFYCGAEQITDIDVAKYTAADEGVDSVAKNIDGVAEDIDVDPYTTAQRALKWKASDVDEVKKGIPIVAIKFANDSTAWQRDKVIEESQAWLTVDAGVSFKFVAVNAKADIIISFSGGTNNSKTGTASKRLARAGTSTMFLPSVKQGAHDDICRRVILHEFGHGVYCFGHEHRHPDAKLTFKSDAFIRDAINAMLPPDAQRWTVGMVKRNITEGAYPTSRKCTSYDTKSIMHYPIQSSWLVAGTPVPIAATRISESDRACAVDVYAKG